MADTPLAMILQRSAPRNHVIGVRVNHDTLKAVDLLIEAGVCETRSAAAAWLLRAGIEAHRDLFERISTTVSQIRDLKVHAQTVTRELTEKSGAHEPT